MADEREGLKAELFDAQVRADDRGKRLDEALSKVEQLTKGAGLRGAP